MLQLVACADLETNPVTNPVSTEDLAALRDGIRQLFGSFPSSYWRELEPDGYPDEFVVALTADGWLSALIPTEYEGQGLSLTAGSVILEEINASGGNSAACHAQMYTIATLLRHGSRAQKERFLPLLARGELRLQAFGITEPTAGSDTTRIATRARRDGDGYVITGQKIWTSRALQSDLMLLLARTATRDPDRPTEGLSVFLIDLRDAGGAIRINPSSTMLNHNTTEVFLDEVRVPADVLVGEEGKGFRYILDSWNAERILISAECIGDGRWFVERATRYATERVVFGRPIGVNHAVQFPIAQAHLLVRSADLMRYRAAELFDAGLPCAEEANSAKYLASEASWMAANVAMDTHGGFGFAREYDVERKFRETRLYRTAPVSNNLVLSYIGRHVLGLPRSY